jgi:hypothetical protein
VVKSRAGDGDVCATKYPVVVLRHNEQNATVRLGWTGWTALRSSDINVTNFESVILRFREI